MTKKLHSISGLDSLMTPEQLVQARKLAERDSLNIRLSKLRSDAGIKQTEVANFTQTAVSKIENRRDIRISTLIDYLDSLGMGLEITAFPKNQTAKKEVLLSI